MTDPPPPGAPDVTVVGRSASTRARNDKEIAMPIANAIQKNNVVDTFNEKERQISAVPGG